MVLGADDNAFPTLKTATSSAPIQKFFDPKEPVTLSADAGSKGVGAATVQTDCPVIYVSKALKL